tara:strand:- start:10 stop:444 length:435 start_codon:yes stop_codon:yes gene_type:complete
MRAKAFGNGHIRGVDLMHRGIDPLHLKESDKGGLTGGIPFVLYSTVGTGDSSPVTVTSDSPLKFRIIDWHVVKTSAASGGQTAKLTDGSSDITNAADLNVAANNIVDGGQIITAEHEIAKGGTLSITLVNSPGCIVYVSCITVS